MEAVHRHGEKKRYNALSNHAKGSILNIGAWGSDQHKHLKKAHPTALSADLAKADIILDADKPFTKKQTKNKTFDTVIAAEIIEHLENPLQFIKSCKSLLKPHGRIILSAPNATSLQHILRPGWGTSNKKFTSPEGHHYHFHINTFTLPMLASLCELNGLKVTHQEYINAFWSNPLPFALAQLIPRLRGDCFIVAQRP
ncbi:hypothetical protein CMI48_00695 [Candidatus Pacearchaeota archaeon]|nr:hypothetical protein [Candidatus Pacearchaeota archaeon]